MFAKHDRPAAHALAVVGLEALLQVVVRNLDRAARQLLERGRRPDRIAHVLILRDALLFRGRLESTCRCPACRPCRRRRRACAAWAISSLRSCSVTVELCLGERLLQQQVRDFDVQHFLAVSQQAFLGQFRVRNLLAVDRGHNARHLCAQLRIVPHVLHRRGVLQFLEQLAGHVAELAFADLLGQLVADRFHRHVAGRHWPSHFRIANCSPTGMIDEIWFGCMREHFASRWPDRPRDGESAGSGRRCSRC